MNFLEDQPEAAGNTSRRIARCVTRIVTHRSEKPQWNPRTHWAEKRITLVFLVLDDGTIGVGEAYCDGGSPDSVVSIIERDLAPKLIGQDPLRTRRLWHEMIDTAVVSAKGGACYAAASALDIAVWDLAGKVLGQPVHRLIGGTSSRVLAYASGGLYGEGKGPDALAEELAGYVKQGFSGVKLKIGGLPIREDVARVRAAREAIGTDVRLMVDALYTYTAADALKLARLTEPFDIHFLEAPVHPDDVEGLRRVCSASTIPVAGNEFAYSVESFRRLIVDAGVHVVHADAILCGGISGARSVADLAAAFHRPVSFHAASSLVCLAANAHVAAAVRNVESVEYHMVHQVLFDVARVMPFSLENGYLQMSEAPGLGIDFLPDFLAASGLES